MSQSNWPVYGFGLIVDDYDTIKKIAALNGYSDPEGRGDCDLMYDFIIDHDGIIMGEETEAKEVNYAETNPFAKEAETVGFAACFYARKQPKPFETAYDTLDDVCREFQERIKFPDDFYVKNHIGHFSCVNWG